MTDTMRRINTRKTGMLMRVTRRVAILPEGAWILRFDRDWQRGLSVELRRVKK